MTGEQWTLLEPMLRPPPRNDDRARPWARQASRVHRVVRALENGASLSKKSSPVRSLDELPTRLIGDKSEIPNTASHDSARPSQRSSTRTGASCVATARAGRLNGCSPGCTISAVFSPHGHTDRKTCSASSTSSVSLSCLDVHETASSITAVPSVSGNCERRPTRAQGLSKVRPRHYESLGAE